MTKYIGYTRVSTGDQNLDLQIDSLIQAGGFKIYIDKVSGVKIERSGLNDYLAHLSSGDVLVVRRDAHDNQALTFSAEFFKSETT